MRRGTTPTLKIKVSGIDLSVLSTVYITLKQGTKTIDKTGTDIVINNDVISCTLTQDETLSLTPRPVAIQMRALTTDGKAIASSIETITVDEVLKGGVLT